MSKARKTYMEEFKREAVSLLEKRVNKRQAEVNLFVDHSSSCNGKPCAVGFGAQRMCGGGS